MKYLIEGKAVTVLIKCRKTPPIDYYAVYKDEFGQSKYLTDKHTWEIWSHKVKTHIYWKSSDQIESILDKLYQSLEVLDFDLGSP